MNYSYEYGGISRASGKRLCENNAKQTTGRAAGCACWMAQPMWFQSALFTEQVMYRLQGSTKNYKLLRITFRVFHQVIPEGYKIHRNMSKDGFIQDTRKIVPVRSVR